MKIGLRTPVLSVLALSIYSHFGYSESLNLSFLHGIQTAPKVLSSNSQFPAGKYFVDVILNQERVGKAILEISSDDEIKNSLCLKPEWLNNAGILFQSSSYSSYFDNEKKCYRIGDEPHTKVDFDYGAQSLKFNVPQAYLPSQAKSDFWDYGINGSRLKYYGNFNKSSNNDINAFGNFDLGINIGRWVLASNSNITHSGDKNKFSTRDLSLSTAINPIRGDFILGKSQTRTNIFSDFGFYGMALRSNNNMRPWSSRGYAPVVNGVANSPSRITVTQGGYTIYSKVVPAGPYVLDDISPVSNGDLVVTVEDDSGRKTKQVYPVATLPSLLRQGEFEYNLALGRKNNNVELKNAFSSGEGTFWLGSLKYGFAFTTLNTAAIIHNKYQSYGGGVTQSLGKLGAIEANYVNAKARYNNGNEKSGNSYNFKYAKSISENTDLQLLTYRHKSKGFVDFSEYYGDGYQFSNIREKSRYEARLSHRFDNFYLNASYWQQNYWQRPGNERGATISGSTTYDKISLYLNGNYSKRPYYRHPEYSVSLSVNIPFDYNERRYYSNNSISYSKYNGTRFNTDVSAVVDDRLNYSIGVDVDSKGNRGSMGSVSYAFDAVQTNLTLSQSNHQTNFSGNVSGSVLATTKSGLLFTKETSNTIGIVNINGMDGVTFNNSLPTNKNGDTVVSLSEYSPNSISINMDNVPDYAELTTTSYNVVPTENAMIYRKFNFEHVRRYILRIKDEKGKILLGGNARTEQGVNAGFVSGKGVLLVNVLAEPKRITIDTDDGIQCGFDMTGINANVKKVHEVICVKG